MFAFAVQNFFKRLIKFPSLRYSSNVWIELLAHLRKVYAKLPKLFGQASFSPSVKGVSRRQDPSILSHSDASMPWVVTTTSVSTLGQPQSLWSLLNLGQILRYIEGVGNGTHYKFFCKRNYRLLKVTTTKVTEIRYLIIISPAKNKER